MFNRQFSNKNQTTICLTVPISSATQKRQKCVQWFTLTTTMFHYEYFAHRDGCNTQHSQHQLTKFTKNRFVSRTPHFLKFEKDLVPLSIAAHTVHAMMLIHVCRLTTDIMSTKFDLCACLGLRLRIDTPFNPWNHRTGRNNEHYECIYNVTCWVYLRRSLFR